MANEKKPELRFAFVELLFALTAAEIAIQFAELYSKVRFGLIGAPAYAHLTLALILVSASWVGWSMSTAPGARRDVYSIFSADFIVLLIDVLLVIFYFIVVKGVDPVTEGEDGQMTIIASAANESLWIATIFGGYFLWDVMTKAVISARHGSERQHRFLSRLLGKAFWARGWVSTTCLAVAIVIWLVVRDVTTPTYVLLSDLALLALVLLFRALKQGAHAWSVSLTAVLILPLAGVYVLGH